MDLNIRKINEELLGFNVVIIESENNSSAEAIDIELKLIDDKLSKDADPFNWKSIVIEANNGNSLLNDAAKLLMIHNNHQFNELNSIYIVNPTKDDVPKICGQCKTPFPSNIGLKGILPSLNSNSQWFYSESEDEKKWAMRIEIKEPFLGFFPIESLRNPYQSMLDSKEAPINIIRELSCPDCMEKQRKILEQIFN